MKKALKIINIGAILFIVLTIFISSAIGKIDSDNEKITPVLETSSMELLECPCSKSSEVLHANEEEQQLNIQLNPNCPFGPVECCWWECTFTRWDKEENCKVAYQALLAMYELWYEQGIIDDFQYQILKEEALEAYNNCMHDALVGWAECIIGCAEINIDQHIHYEL